MSIVRAHSFMYTERCIGSGIRATDCTMSPMSAALRIGSPEASSISSRALKVMKSCSWVRTYSCTPAAPSRRAKVSGSSSGGSSTTRTFMPSPRIMSMPRSAA